MSVLCLNRPYVAVFTYQYRYFIFVPCVMYVCTFPMKCIHFVITYATNSLCNACTHVANNYIVNIITICTSDTRNSKHHILPDFIFFMFKMACMCITYSKLYVLYMCSCSA